MVDRDPRDAALRFIRLCLRSRWDPPALDGARALLTQLAPNAHAVCELARRERVGPLLYDAVRKKDLLPAEVEAALRQSYYLTAACNLRLFEALDQALRALAARGIEVIVLKGAALAQTVYPSVGLRPMGDLDVLVRPASVPAAREVLAELGYHATGVEVRPGSDLAFESEVCLVRPGPPAVPLELHWSLFDVPHYQQTLPLSWFWATAQTVPLGGGPALVLGPEALLLHLCGHLVLHHGSSEAALLWEHDVAAVLAHDQPAIDWPLLLRQAEECALVLPLQEVLGRVAAEWAAPVPPDALAQLNALTPGNVEAQTVAQRTAARRPVARRFWNDLASLHGWRARLRYAWIQLFPAPAYMRHRYGITRAWLLPLYYPYRWSIGLRGLWSRR
ncbi:MAG TPA: nucleotidyltransferase family protein [Anaerolineae bacterium]|nr:nucleotidyltransferase family protein [Anaerolineae bacterium]